MIMLLLKTKPTQCFILPIAKNSHYNNGNHHAKWNYCYARKMSFVFIYNLVSILSILVPRLET